MNRLPVEPPTAARAADTGTPRSPAPDPGPEVLDRRVGALGEIVLRRHGELLQVIANGCFLMDTSDGRSERLLVRAARDLLVGRRGEGARPGAPPGTPPAEAAPALLIGGLGVGFSLDEAAADPLWGSITVVEREAAVLEWHRDGPLGRFTERARADRRTSLVHADLMAHLRAPGAPWDAMCLDIDNGPDWTVSPDNSRLYSPRGLSECHDRLTPGGVLAVWSAQPSADFEAALCAAGFDAVRTVEVPVARGVPDVVHLAARAAWPRPHRGSTLLPTVKESQHQPAGSGHLPGAGPP
ncbi:spermidine synthase [Streptomyces sp. ST2-7A]|uniref:spermidine synthase n=1 Tax=Streptomyces sp. ST2-7A TaxID=2907214 RepID=UPI001F3D476B|nr:spermidine synthase [Streptomyces sp. ST2-7A]MCE7082749.1 spermidine synthase [Streptomyces sp. ST2-7A]